MIVELDGTSLRAADVERIARGQAAMRVTETGRRRIPDAFRHRAAPFLAAAADGSSGVVILGLGRPGRRPRLTRRRPGGYPGRPTTGAATVVRDRP